MPPSHAWEGTFVLGATPDELIVLWQPTFPSSRGAVRRIEDARRVSPGLYEYRTIANDRETSRGVLAATGGTIRLDELLSNAAPHAVHVSSGASLQEADCLRRMVSASVRDHGRVSIGLVSMERDIKRQQCVDDWARELRAGSRLSPAGALLAIGYLTSTSTSTTTPDADVTRVVGDALLHSVPADSNVWMPVVGTTTRQPYVDTISALAGICERSTEFQSCLDYYDRVIERHASRDLIAALLATKVRLLTERGDAEAGLVALEHLRSGVYAQTIAIHLLDFDAVAAAVPGMRAGDEFPQLPEIVGLDPQDPSRIWETRRPLLLHFWASWCRACEPSIETVRGLANRPDVRVVSVSLDEDRDDALQAARAMAMGWPQGWVGEADAKEVINRVGAWGLPTVVLIGCDHRIVWARRDPGVDLDALNLGIQDAVAQCSGDGQIESPIP